MSFLEVLGNNGRMRFAMIDLTPEVKGSVTKLCCISAVTQSGYHVLKASLTITPVSAQVWDLSKS